MRSGHDRRVRRPAGLAYALAHSHEVGRANPVADLLPQSYRRAGRQGPGQARHAAGAPPDDNWQPLIRVDAADGTRTAHTLKVHYTLPTPCAPGLRRAEVTERADAVVVKLHRDPPAKSDVICTQVIKERSVDVHLDTPVGDRPLVDGSSGRVVKLRG